MVVLFFLLIHKFYYYCRVSIRIKFIATIKVLNIENGYKNIY